MIRRGFCLIFSCLCLMALLAGCIEPETEGSFEKLEAGSGQNGTNGDSVVIVGGGNGIIGQYPDDEPEEPEPTEPPEPMAVLPDGTSVPEDEVQTLDDGTLVVETSANGHKCFFTDGTWAVTHYSDPDGRSCAYADAATVLAKWYLENGLDWRHEEYIVQTDGERFLRLRYEYEYSPLEEGSDPDKGDAWYHSATNELFYDEYYGDYKTARSEYDPLHGSEKPYYCTYYDGSYSEHEYNLDGTKKKDSFYSAEGILQQQEFYENGLMVTQYLFWEDGTQQYITHYENGVITLEKYYSEGGGYHSTTYYKNGVRSYQRGEFDSGLSSSIYYDENGYAVKYLQNARDGSLVYYALYENYDDGNLKKATYYDADGQITQVEEYDENGVLIEG